jgi:type IV secretion system protein VirB3
MDEKEQLEFDILFAGITRPAMLFGVTLDFALANGFTAAMILIGSGNPLFLLMIIPIHAIGFVVCLNDPRFFSVIKCWLINMSRCPNRWFWGKPTYNP